MTTVKRNEDEAAIRRLIGIWQQGVRDKNVEAIMRHYAADLLLFDLAPPLAHRGAEAYRESLEAWFPTFDGPIRCDMRDLTVHAADALAFATSINRISGKKKSGEEADVWVRVTLCFRKENGRWLVAHEHVSVPFYMDGSFKAATDLEP